MAMGGFFFLIYGYLNRKSSYEWSIVALGIFSMGMSVFLGLGWIMNKKLPNMPSDYVSIMKELKDFDLTADNLTYQIFQFKKIDFDQFFEFIC